VRLIWNIYPINYTNNRWVIAQNAHVEAINNAVELDLYSQVCSESSDVRRYREQGGQFDFIFGAYKSKGDKAFICLSSTVKSNGGGSPALSRR